MRRKRLWRPQQEYIPPPEGWGERRSVDDPSLLEEAHTFLNLVVDPYVDPGKYHAYLPSFRRMFGEDVFNFDVVLNQQQDRAFGVLLCTLRGQSVCDTLYGTGKLPSEQFMRKQVEGERAADFQFAQVAFIPLDPSVDLAWRRYKGTNLQVG